MEHPSASPNQNNLSRSRYPPTVQAIADTRVPFFVTILARTSLVHYFGMKNGFPRKLMSPRENRGKRSPCVPEYDFSEPDSLATLVKAG